MSRSFTSREIDWGADEIADAPDVESPDTERTSAHRGTQPDGVPHAHQTGACGLDADALEDAQAVAAEGQKLLTEGVKYVVDGIIPAYGVVGMNVAYAKVGKTSFGMALSGTVATGAPFLDRQTQQARVLFIAAEDPPEYCAFLARHLNTVPLGKLTFYRRPVLLDSEGLAAIAGTVASGGYGLVVIASWQAVVSGLVREENDNAGAVRVVTQVKATARQTGIPWLIDAHSGKGEDQRDDADPTRALRGASSAAGAADFMLSLRYAGSPFTSRRRLSGKGRFVNVEPMLLDYDNEAGTYTVIADTTSAARETTWRLLIETGALTEQPRSITDIARTAGLLGEGTRINGATRRRIIAALHGRDGIVRTNTVKRGKTTDCFHRQPETAQ
jgi:hypothetical protein